MLPKGLWLATTLVLPIVALAGLDPLLAHDAYVDQQVWDAEKDHIDNIKTFVDGVNVTLKSPDNFLGYTDNQTRLNVRDAYNYATECTKTFMAFAKNSTSYTGYTQRDYAKYGPQAAGEFTRMFDLLVKTLDDMPAPFGERQCRLLPDHGLPDTEQLETMRQSMINGTYKLGKSISSSELGKVCTNFGNAFTPTTFARKLQTAANMMGTKCAAQDPSNSWRAALLAYALHHRMDGGDSNGCLHLFVGRFTNSQDAVDKLKSAIIKYTFLGVNIESFCDIATGGGFSTGEILKHELFPVAQAFRSAVATLNSVSPNKTGPWICDEKAPIPTTSTSEHPSDNTTRTTKGHTDQAVDATAAPTRSRAILALLKETTSSVLSISGMEGSMAWVQRAEKHQKIADEIYKKLEPLSNRVSFQVFVTLPQDKDPSAMQCMDSVSDRHIKSFKSRGVSYFIQYFVGADGLRVIWKEVTDSKEKVAQIVNAVFSAKTSDLCKVAKDVIAKIARRKVFERELGFSGLAVVRCGRKFVWYQLGYRYFLVGRAAGRSYELASTNDAYDAKCGQIFLFP